MLESVLIANRGEIACRIIRTARRLGMRTIAVHSEADAKALFVRMADEAHLIGPAPARESYLVIDKIIEVARRTGAACIHPGYGFLSERAEFARACRDNGIVFVGPPPEAIDAMGLKDAAKALVEKAGVPVVPGYLGESQDPDVLKAKARELGYPVLIKAVAGGGGKGMRRVETDADFAPALESARREAQNAFGDPRVLVEKYILSPRHIEIQVFADTHGNVVHLFERDCSLQRRHQKVIEEAPAPGMTSSMRHAMGKAAVEAARAVGYVGAGTIEFIADGREGLHPDRFYFMEMNTRLQVEHPVTEAITGLDLVELQFRVAAGEALPFMQADLSIKGHAVEARLYAEDPERDFLPSTGKLWALDFPEGEGLRIDAGVTSGDEVTPFYDPMIAKIIARGDTRDEALSRLAHALGETVVAGPKTNLAFLKKLCEAGDFRAEHFDTGFIDRNLAALGAVPQEIDAEAVRLGVLKLLNDVVRKRELSQMQRHGTLSPWDKADAFQIGPPRRQTLPVMVDGERADVAVLWHGPRPGSSDSHIEIQYGDGSSFRSLDDASTTWSKAFHPTADGLIVLHGGRQTRIGFHDPFAVDPDHLDGGGSVKAPMHGKLVAVFIVAGDQVEKGQRLAIVEAMKMEHVLLAPAAGEIEEVLAMPGAQVSEGARLIVLKARE